MSRKTRKNVGLIGLGIIGSRAAASLRAAGWHVFVWNRTPKPVANFLGSPAEVADTSEIIQLFVSDAQAVFAMIEAFGESLTDRHIVLCSSTIGPEATQEAARMVQARGAQFLDAPFTGSRGAAERAQLVYYVGGDDAVYARAKPVLEGSSKAIVRCGKIGDAATLKVVTNLISAVTTQTLAEVLAITRRAGIGPDVLAAAIEQNACRSGVVELKLPKMVTGDYEPHFSLKHMFKDVQLGIHLANSLDLEVPATTVTAGVMYGALNQGWGDLDYASLFKTYEIEFSRFSQRELASPKVEDLPDANPAAESVVHDKPASRAEAIPVEIIVEEPKAVDAVVAPLEPVGNVSRAAEATPAAEPKMPEAKPPGQEVPAEAAKGDAPNPVVEAKAGNEPNTGEPKSPEKKADAGKPEEAKGDEPKPPMEKSGEDRPEAAKDGEPKGEAGKMEEPKSEAAKEVNGGIAPPMSEGEANAAKARPFNRIFRRFFSPAGK